MPAPRILVLQPLIAPGSPFDYRMLGYQYLIADCLTQAGFEGASGLFRRPDPSDRARELVGTETPSDGELRKTLLEHGARYGLLSWFEAFQGEPSLSTVRLCEVRRGRPLRTLARWQFGGETHSFPLATCTVLVDVAARLGREIQPANWEALLGTADEGIASSYLAALGCYSAADQGFVIAEPERALRAMVLGIQGGMGPAVNMMPRLVEALAESGSADEATLRAAVEAALEVVGDVPTDWEPMLRELRLAGRGPLN